MENTPRGNRLHIAIFGRRNAGKSSLINALTSQDIAVVSNIPGTTTDPVYKAMEILPVGPVVIIDTAGIDDSGDLGELRVKRSMDVLNKADMVLLVIDAGSGVTDYELKIARRCQEKKLPVVVVFNKIDAHHVTEQQIEEAKTQLAGPTVVVSALNGQGIGDLKIAIVNTAPATWDDQAIVGDLLNPGDTAVLVVPIDSAAPKGRLILPQVQTIRDILDHDAMAYVAKESELKECIANFIKKPKMVITDSQAFREVEKDTPEDILLTSFSILFARYKGDLETLVAGAKAIERLKPGDKVLISEACTHHRMEDDIGTVKIPRWLRQVVGGDLEFHWSSGHRFPEDLSDYKLVVHCGACMVNRREMLSRIMQVQQVGVPIVNYGVCIAFVMGILRRALSPFPTIQQMLNDKK
ncbi:iron-only hydrogenase maturation protein HydF [Desulforamulus reducens MI-1]|uniref:Iron-only hydrogenase maturation protein HydF n=1 Tax=Desulforamulus reducens (strain ATCC BAA-1160 / DSM 100696 / MI-1) TaxID=349161 RepID=A4J6G6_DESRM|nr:[FeFe] hydrogenase H-cluster maturation GTPase HydF [Desulforamulus reducens]ABO50669.1 iron-only hydrogenase maturation protein HydF [Desulforamulus reducens MI-1]